MCLFKVNKYISSKLNEMGVVKVEKNERIPKKLYLEKLIQIMHKKVHDLFMRN